MQTGQPEQTDNSFSHEEILRYSRHLIMPEVRLDGQQKLKHAKVLIIGAGGLGSPLALYLAAAGVGTLGIVDFDVVDLTNLQRQILHSTDMVGKSKLFSAKERIHEINPYVAVTLHEVKLTSNNAMEIITQYDIIVDGTDNFPTRYLVNDACVLLQKPNVYGSIFRFDGQVSVFDAAKGPCYRCLYPSPPPQGLVPSCAEGGVLGVLPGIIGTLQALEVIKIILGEGELLIGRLLLFDGLKMQFREMKLRKNPACPVCGEHKTITHLIDYVEFCGYGIEETSVQVNSEMSITPENLKKKIDNHDQIFILDVREPHEYLISNIKGYLIPLNDLQERKTELPPHQEIIIHCKSGIRSAKAVAILKDAGFTNVKSLAGGINAWAEKIDSTIPKY